MRKAILVCLFTLSMATVGRSETLLVAGYDGNTGNGGKNADFAAGSPSAIVAGTATIDSANKKYGAGSLNTTDVTNGGNGLRYATAGNFNPQAGTVEAWIRVPGYTGATRETVFSIFAGGYTGDFTLFLDPTQGGRLHVTVDANGANQWSQIGYQPASYYADGNFHHVAWEWDTAAGFSTLYVDGVAENYNHVGTVAFAGTLGTHMEVGSWQGGWDSISGNLDDLRISSTALYNQVSSFTPPGPVVPEPATALILLCPLALLRRR